jgi:hypothetical protein
MTCWSLMTAGGTRSDDQEVPRVPQRNTYCGTTLRLLHLPTYRIDEALREIDWRGGRCPDLSPERLSFGRVIF